MYSKRSIETQTAVKLGSSHFNSMDRTRTALHHSHGHGHQQNHRTLNPVTALTSALRRAFSCFSNSDCHAVRLWRHFLPIQENSGLANPTRPLRFIPLSSPKGGGFCALVLSVEYMNRRQKCRQSQRLCTNPGRLSHFPQLAVDRHYGY